MELAAPGPANDSYLQEAYRHRRVLAAVCCGMGAGFLLNHYVANIFAPHLIAEFGWSRAEFALVGMLGFVTLLIVPFVGRLTDLIGVKPIAAVGVISFPLTFIAFSAMNGSIAVFAAITTIQVFLTGATTASTVYSRLIAERFVGARGLALALAATSPALVGVIASPPLNDFIESHGWRWGYLAVAAYTAGLGAIALLLMPGQKSDLSRDRPKRKASKDYSAIFRSSTFWIIAGGFLLCNLIYPLQSSQMNLMLIENGASMGTAAWMISLFAGGVMVGRFVCGLALDRFPAHLVAAIALGLPAIGLSTLGLGFNSTLIMACSVAVMGFSLGAESDLAAFLVIRYFPLQVYGTVLGLVVMSLGLSAVLGASLLSLTLALFDHFRIYMLIAAATCALGAGLFLLLANKPHADSAAEKE